MNHETILSQVAAGATISDAEALALALPDFPRAEGVELGPAVFTEPGATPMTDEAAKPLAGLADLRDRLKKND